MGEELLTKEYEGKKIILATPMNRAQYNIYRGWELPEDENGADEGMLVEYVDGGKANHPDHEYYISWSPLEVFKNAYTEISTFQQRMELEKKELDAKIFLTQTALEGTMIPEGAKPLLALQLDAMKKYSTILEIRASENYDMEVNFGMAIEALKAGMLVTRAGWNKAGQYVMKQIPAEIGLDIIPKMQSVQQAAKDILVKSGTTLKYTNQMLLIQPDGRADSWVPSSSDVFAEDWVIL